MTGHGKSAQRAMRSWEYSSSRLPGYPQRGRESKVRTHRKERMGAKGEIREQVLEMEEDSPLSDETNKELDRLRDMTDDDRKLGQEARTECYRRIA